MSDVTRILQAVQQGDANAAEALLPLIYQELRKLAAAKMAQEAAANTCNRLRLILLNVFN